jgi:hypothetical protein
LSTYLAASTLNHVVLTDYASMEAYKGDAQVIYRSMRILSAYPKQVIILKSTRDVCSLSAQQTASPENLIDHDQTQGFPTFCRNLAKAQGNVGGGLIKQRIARKGQGRSGGYRMMIAYRAQNFSVFLFGFAKSDENKEDGELKDVSSKLLGHRGAHHIAAAQCV